MSERMIVSNSKANTYRRCPKSFEFKYRMKLRKKRPSIYLKRGDWLHQLLMVHYDGHDWQERHNDLTQQFNRLFDEEKDEYGDLPTDCSRIMSSYLRHYREEDKRWRVVETELDELVDLPNGDKFRMIIDMIAEEDDGGLWVIDHKSVSGFMPPDYLLLDAQLARYAWGAEVLGIKPIRGVIYNEIITKAPTLPKFLEPSQRLEMRKNIHCDAYTYLAEIKRHGQDPRQYKDFLLMLKGRHGDWFRRSRLPRDKPMIKTLMKELLMTTGEIKAATAANKFPRTVIKRDCAFSCDYLEPCIAQLQGADIEDIIRLKYEISTRDEDPEPGWVPKKGK